MDFSNQLYIVQKVPGFDLTTALRLWKTFYKDFSEFAKESFLKNGDTSPIIVEFEDFVYDMWNDIKPVTVEEALQEQNIEKRRVYFNCIGVEQLFKELEPTLVDRQEVTKKRTRWDDNNDAVEYEFNDVYELYSIDAKKLFNSQRNSLINSGSVYAVRCWCTTTNREYWIYVPSWVGQKNDALEAIAWTIRIDTDDVERIYRQGDIIVVKKTEEGKCRPYHLDKQMYLNLMYSET